MEAVIVMIEKELEHMHSRQEAKPAVAPKKARKTPADDIAAAFRAILQRADRATCRIDRWRAAHHALQESRFFVQ